MIPNQRQKFTSYIAFADDARGMSARAVRYLPREDTVGESYAHSSATLHVVGADGNPLHDRFVGRDGPYLFFVQGEFYDDVLLAGILDCGGPDGVALDELASFLRRLNGVFAGVVIDTARKESHAFTDRFGFSRQYWSFSNGSALVSSSFWPFAMIPELSGGINKEAIQDILMCGFPLGCETPCRSVSAVMPGTIVTIGSGRSVVTSYYDYTREPSRGEDHLRSFRSASEDHFAAMMSRTGSPDFCLALSGGHDSRVILNAMIHSGIRPKCFTGYDHSLNSDSKRARKVAERAGCESIVFNYSDWETQDTVDANILLDGAGTGGWSMNLGKAAREHGNLIYFGSSGDLLSGGWSIHPGDYSSIDPLAEAVWDAYFYDYNFPQEYFLRITPERDRSHMVHRLRSTFPERTDHLADGFLEHRIKVRNFRRIRMFMQGAYLHNSPVHFFHDNRISDLYWRVPMDRLLWQKLHVRLCSFAVPGLSRIPATNYPIPVGAEPWLLPAAKKVITPGFRKKFLHFRGRAKGLPENHFEGTLAALSDHEDSLGLDLGAMRKILGEEVTAGLLFLRSRYAAAMVNPGTLVDQSSLFGPCEFETRADSRA